MPDYRILLPTKDRERAMWVIGLPGSGKSRALETWMLQDILKGRGCGFLDPAADTFNRMLTRLAEQWPQYPDLDKRLVIIDPTNPKWTIGFNPLEPIPGVYPERVGKFMTDVVLKIWKMEPGDAPRTVRLLTATFTALVELQRSLLDLPRFLGDKAWREPLLAKISSPIVSEYFMYEFPKSEREAATWVAPTLTRLGALLDDPDTKMMLFPKSTISFRQLMDEQKILLVNLSKGQLSDEGSWLLGAFIVAQIQKAAMARADSVHRPPFYLYLDEFQNYTTANIQDIIAEARKFGLALILAHQYIDQLKGDLRSAVTNISGTIVAFLVSESDSTFLAKALFPPHSLTTTNYGWEKGRLKQITNAPSPVEVEAQLTMLHPQEYWMRQRGDNPPIKGRTFRIADPTMTPELAANRERLIDSVMARCGRLKSDVAVEMKARQRHYGGPNTVEFTFYEDKPA